jgi:hypothetical protein
MGRSELAVTLSTSSRRTPGPICRAVDILDGANIAVAPSRRIHRPWGYGSPRARGRRRCMTRVRLLHLSPHAGRGEKTQLRDLAAGFARVLPAMSRSLKSEGAVLPQEGSRECRALDAPAALRAKNRKHASKSPRSHRNHPAFPARLFTAYSALSSVIGLSCHRRLRRLLRKLDASVEASGPHSFAVRFMCCSSSAHSASTASRLTSLTIAKRP